MTEVIKQNGFGDIEIIEDSNSARIIYHSHLEKRVLRITKENIPALIADK